jgi:hypothetical protein
LASKGKTFLNSVWSTSLQTILYLGDEDEDKEEADGEDEDEKDDKDSKRDEEDEGNKDDKDIDDEEAASVMFLDIYWIYKSRKILSSSVLARMTLQEVCMRRCNNFVCI